MKTQLISKLVSVFLLVAAPAALAQRSVMVQSNTSVILYPTNFWSANASSARSGLGLSAVATNPVTPLSNGGTGSTNASGARTNLSLGWSGLTNTNASSFRSALELSASWLTNTNTANFRSDIGIGTGATNTIGAGVIKIPTSGLSFNEATDNQNVLVLPSDTDPVLLRAANWNDINVRGSLGFSTNLNTLWTATNASNARSAVGLPLATLTNDSNVKMMRALSGSTNTAHPYSGSISVTGTNNTNTLVFSNGILQSVQ